MFVLTAAKPWARKRPREGKPKEGKLEQAEDILLKQLAEPDDDDVLLFLRSLAPKMREVPNDTQFMLRMEMMQLLVKYAPMSSSMPTPTPTPPLRQVPTPPQQLNHNQIPPPTSKMQLGLPDTEWYSQYTMLG